METYAILAFYLLPIRVNDVTTYVHVRHLGVECHVLLSEVVKVFHHGVRVVSFLEYGGYSVEQSLAVISQHLAVAKVVRIERLERTERLLQARVRLEHSATKTSGAVKREKH